MSDIPNLLTQGPAANDTSEKVDQNSSDPASKVSKSVKLPSNLSLDDLPPLLKVSEVAKILRVSPLTVKRWTRRGRLPAIRINSRGDRRYRKETILYYLGIQQK